MVSPLRELPLARLKLLTFSSSTQALRSASVTSRIDSGAASPSSCDSQFPRSGVYNPSLFEFPPAVTDAREKLSIPPLEHPNKRQLSQDFSTTDRMPKARSRDVSYRYDVPLPKAQRMDHKELAEALGIEAPAADQFPLPTDLGKLEELLAHTRKDTLLKGAEETPMSTDWEQPMEEFEHQRFIDDIEQFKKKVLQYTTSQDRGSALYFQVKSAKETKSQRSSPRLPRPNDTAADYSKPVHLHNGKPSGKREIELLTQWLDYMTRTHLEHIPHSSAKTHAAQLIYTAGFREVTRQVSVHCAARGLLMDRIWNSSVEMYMKSERAFVKQLNELKRRFREVVAKSQAIYEEKLKVVTKKFADMNAEIRRETKRAEESEKENEELKGALGRERKRIRDLQESVRTLSNTTLALKIEEEKKRLADEFNKARGKPAVPKRNVATSTTEDEFLQQESATTAVFSLARKAKMNVVLQGSYDEKGRFHKSRELRTNAKGCTEILDFTDELVSEIPAHHKETNTEEDLGWTFFDQPQLAAIRRKMLDIPEEEILKGIWISDYQDLVEERKHRDLTVLLALKALFAIKLPAVTGASHRGTQLFGHELKVELDPSHTVESSDTSIDFPPLGPRRESVEVVLRVKHLEELLHQTRRHSIATVGLELLKTAEATDSQDGVTVPTAVLTAMGKMMVNSAFGEKGGDYHSAIVEEDMETVQELASPLSQRSPELRAADAASQTEFVEILRDVGEAGVQTEAVEEVKEYVQEAFRALQRKPMQPQSPQHGPLNSQFSSALGPLKVALKRSHPTSE